MDHPRGDRDRLLGMGVLSGLTFLVLCLTPPLRFLVGLVSNFILAGIIGFQLAELMDRKYRKEVRLKHPTVFISGCDSALGLHMAKRLHEPGFEVHAGVLDPGSEGATTLKGMRVHVVPLDYMDEDSIVQAYKTVTTQLGDKEQPRSSRVVDEIKDIFTIIPDTFRAYGRRSKLNGGPGIFSPSPVSPLSPWNPLNPLSPISPVSAVSRLTPGDPLRPISRAQVRAVDTVSKRLVDLFNARTGSKKSSCISGICNLQA